jgi:hypothetical protein
MVLLLAIAGVLLVLVLAAAFWLLGPTLRTFKGPDFEPTAKDDDSVFQAQQTNTITGGGAMGGS